MKFTFVSIFLLGLISTGAQALATPISQKAAFYIGPSIGASQVLARQNLVYYNIGAPYTGGVRSYGHHTRPFWGVAGGSFIPLGEKNFIDIDLYYLNQNNTVNFAIDNNGYMFVSMKLKKKYSYGLGLSLGRTFYEEPLPLSAYLSLGWERGQIKTAQLYDGIEYNGQIFHQTHTFNSPFAGLGLKLDITPRFFCKLSYTYVFPKDINLLTPYTENNGGYYKYKFTHSEQRFDLTLGWKF